MDGNDGLVLGDAGVIRFFPGQFIEMAIEDLLKKGGKTKEATGRLSPDGGHHELHVNPIVNLAEYFSLNSQQFVVQMLLSRSEWHDDRLGLPDREISNVAAAGSVDDTGEGVHPLRVGDHPYAFLVCNPASQEFRADPTKIRIVPEYGLAPGRGRRLIESFHRQVLPFRRLRPHRRHRLIDKRVRLSHVREALLIDDEIGAERIQKNKEVVVAELDRGGRQENYRFSMIAEKLHGLVAECILVSNVVSLIDNNQIEAGWRIKVQEAFFPLPLSFGSRAIQECFIELGVRDDAFLVLLRPDTIQIHFVNAIPQGSAIKMGKTLLEAFHLVLPLFLGNQRARADNEHGTYLAPRLKLAQDEASFNGLTYTNAVGNEQARTIRPDKPQHRSELIGDEVDTGGVE